jgi:hypothetical protein
MPLADYFILAAVFIVIGLVALIARHHPKVPPR